MNNKKKIFITIISIFSLVAITFVIPNVKADSGWDSSYDGGGGSWSSGGGSSSLDSGGYSWSGSGSSSGSYSGSSFTFLLVIICVVLFIYFTKDNTGYKASTRSSREALYKEIEDDKILGMPLEEFKALVFEKYKDIQIAWMNFDYDTLRKLTTDEIYNSYKMQLDVLRMKKQKNIMKDFELKGVKVYKAENVNGMLNVSIYLNVEMYDYVVDENDKVVRGSSSKKISIEYEITFVKKENTSEETICPNCGAKVDVVTGAKCEYCGSVVVVDAKEYVMSKKTCVNQRNV